MADLSNLSNEELMQYVNKTKTEPKQESVKAPVYDLSKLSNEDLVKLVDETSPAKKAYELNNKITETVAAPLSAVGNTYDRFITSPTRAAIGAVQEGNNPFKAFGKQFGEDPNQAPSGKQIATKAGLSTNENMIFPFKGPNAENIKVSPAGSAGFGIDVVADPTNFIPIKTIAGVAGRAVGEGAVLAGKAAIGAADLATGSRVFSTAADAAKNIGKSAKLAVTDLFNPKIASDFAEMSSIAVKNGLDPKILPEAIEFGRDSFITKAASHKMVGPLGQEELAKFNASLDATKSATENQIATVANGPVLSKQEAGGYIRQAFDEGVDNFFNKVEVTHDKIIKDYPGLTLTTGYAAGDTHIDKLNSVLNDIEKFAKRRVQSGFTDLQEAQGRRLLKSVEAIRSTNGSYADTVEALRNIGEAAFKSQNTAAAIPADISKMRDLYGALNDALISTVRTNVSPELANELFLSNKEMSQFIGQKNPLAKVIGNPSLSDEAVFRTLVENGDSNKIQALHQVLGSEKMQPVKAAWMNSLIKRDLNEGFSFQPIAGALQNKKIVFENLLSPEEISNFRDIVRLGLSHGNVPSIPGAGASGVFNDIVGAVKSGLGNDAFLQASKERAREAELSKQSTSLRPPLTSSNGDFTPIFSEGYKQFIPQSTEFSDLVKLGLKRPAKAAQVINSQDQGKIQQQNAFQRRLQQK